MSDQNPSKNLPLFDRLTSTVPGYQGYDVRTGRRSAAFALRDVLSRRLSQVRTMIDETRDSCQKREAISEIHALDRVGRHLDLIIERVGGLGTRIGSFYEAPDFDKTKLDPIYAIDHDLLEKARSIAHRFEHPVDNRDLLAEVELSLRDLENTLDKRAFLLRNLD